MSTLVGVEGVYPDAAFEHPPKQVAAKMDAVPNPIIDKNSFLSIGNFIDDILLKKEQAFKKPVPM